MALPLLEIRELHTYFHSDKGVIRAVNGVSYTLERGKTLGIVGESGSGKSVSAMSILRLFSENGYIESGEIIFDGRDLVKVSEAELYEIRGKRISVIFQEPMTSLNPVFSIEKQVSEPFRIHLGMTGRQARAACIDALRSVQIPNPEALLKAYPHQLSGGMRQRVMIAMALATRPDVLIADEPTTALDVTVQAEILGLMKQLQKQRKTAILFISHDLGVIHEMADDVAVIYCGRVVETASAKALFGDLSISHPYTEGLLRAILPLGGERARLVPIAGAPPHPLALPRGCKFAPRCPYATAKCVEEEPPLFEVADGRRIRCFYPERKVRESAKHQKALIG